MRSTSFSTAALLILNASFAAAGEPLDITVRVFDTASVSDRMLSEAQQLATGLYERVGIRIHWVRGDRKTLARVEREKPLRLGSGCASLNQIDIKIQPSIRGISRTSILAKAYPFRRSGLRVEVPMSQLVAHSFATGVPIPILLGRVLAHEVGHILIGSNSHSRTGIMRPELGWTDMMRPVSEVPMFEGIDAEYIRGNIERSAAGCPPIVAVR
jgi:hypothetical protein